MRQIRRYAVVTWVRPARYAVVTWVRPGRSAIVTTAAEPRRSRRPSQRHAEHTEGHHH
jgi:hypothetical protein